MACKDIYNFLSRMYTFLPTPEKKYKRQREFFFENCHFMSFISFISAKLL